MKHSSDFPPNYQEIVATFGDVSKRKPVFCYGDTLYNPFGVTITRDLEHHEEVHMRQQEKYSDPRVWYNIYLNDPAFRLEQEKEAYGAQYLFARENGISGKLLDWLREKISFGLSSEIYGNLISFGEANSFLRHYGR